MTRGSLGGNMIWLIGCKGMLGSEVAKQLEEKKLPWVGTDKEVDITDPQALLDFTNKIETAAYFPSDLRRADRKIRWIINCSAYTNVDKAEEDVELAEKLNATGPLNIARLARSIGAKLIHISTDYVFDGQGSTPYTEDMAKAPLGVYGRTKAAGGIRPRMTSRIIPPPVAVTVPRTMTPKTSDRFRRPTNAPEIEKAMVPITSQMKIIESMLYTYPKRL